MNRRAIRNGLTLAAVAALLAWFWSRGERFLDANGPTFDEPAHLAAGYSYWATGGVRMNPEHPPLLKLLWAAPAFLADPSLYPSGVASATGGDHWHVGTALLFHSGKPPRELLDPARRVNLALGCCGILLAGWWAYRLWNARVAGVAACAFAASDPNWLALSCVLTTDVGLALFALLACYLLWEYAARPNRGLLVASGVALGLALGAKFSALAVVAGLGAAGFVYVLRGGTLALPGTPAGAPRWRAAAELAFRLGLVALVALAATYGFVYFDQWGAGLKFQLTRARHGDGVMYLNGELSRAGWYHYFLVLLPLKLPLGLMAAALLSATALLRRGCASVFTPPLAGEVGEALRAGWVGDPDASRAAPPSRRVQSDAATSPSSGEVKGKTRPALMPGRMAFLLVPPLVFFAAGSYSRVDLGIRVVLPVLPFLYVLAAGLACAGCCRAAGRVLLAACLAWCATSAARGDPNPLAYFNELAGGPRGAVRSAADSNLDWGQGLPQLKHYLDETGTGPVYLSYFGTDRPEAYGIRYRPLPTYGRVGEPGGEVIPADSPRHVLVVSANNLLGIYLNDPDTFAWLRGREPAAVVAGCLYVFDLTGDAEAISRVRSLPTRYCDHGAIGSLRTRAFHRRCAACPRRQQHARARPVGRERLPRVLGRGAVEPSRREPIRPAEAPRGAAVRRPRPQRSGDDVEPATVAGALHAGRGAARDVGRAAVGLRATVRGDLREQATLARLRAG
jgi:hypothetical protein